ncbi:MAG: diguanylate cyclase [Colwellia sp.]|nr:diguanylate cyclase [Colwellia sp.]
MLNRRRRFSLLLAILLLSGFLTTSWLSYRVAHDSIEAKITNDALPLTTDNIYSEIQHDLFKPVFISSLMAQDTFVRDWKLNGENNPEKLIKYLKEIQKKYHTITSYFISDATRNYYHPNGIIKKISTEDSQDQWYFHVKNLPESVDYEVNVDNDTAHDGRLVVFVNYKVFDYDHNFIGITGVGLALDTVKQLIESYQQRYQRTVMLVDREGNIKLNGDSLLGSLDIFQRSGIKEHAATILTNTSSSIRYQMSGKTVYLNSRYIDELSWYLIVEQHSDPSEKKLTDTFKLNILLSILVTAAVLLIAHLTFNKYQKRLEAMATIDKLSGLLNRQAFDPILENNLEQSKRKKDQLSLIIIDIDNFKKINDTFGHLVGDKVIQQIAQTCKLYSRESDAICRWGGEEFLIMLADTEINAAIDIAERIKKHLSKNDNKYAVTVSFGITQYQHNESVDTLLNRADSALYKAKGKGKNRLEIS